MSYKYNFEPITCRFYFSPKYSFKTRKNNNAFNGNFKNNYNFGEEIFNEEILYKFFNLDFILESKEYHQKIYMKLIISLLLLFFSQYN